jgi:predicted nucleotidyltransferase
LETNPRPTPHRNVNALLAVLLENIRAVLGPQFIGMYLDGSLACGGFDADSDIDFIVVVDREIDPAGLAALQAMHDRIAKIDSPWALQLEGSYIPLAAIRRYRPPDVLHPNLERGPGERLKVVGHDEDWIIHRRNLREHGITLAGPDPRTLVDPVSPEELQDAMRAILRKWWAGFLDDRAPRLQNRGYQSYAVLSMCRILYTLRTGSVASKRAAAAWAKTFLSADRGRLIERAWDGRHHPGDSAAAEDIAETQEFIRETLADADCDRRGFPDRVGFGEGG